MTVVNTPTQQAVPGVCNVEGGTHDARVVFPRRIRCNAVAVCTCSSIRGYHLVRFEPLLDLMDICIYSLEDTIFVFEFGFHFFAGRKIIARDRSVCCFDDMQAIGITVAAK